jgi:hypothetical protein
MVNWDLSGQIRLNSSSGTRIADEVVAAVIAPGRALGQDRSSSPGMSNCPGNFNASNYLEARTGIGNNHTPSAVASGVTTLANGSANDPVLNDQVIHITAQELLAISRKRPDFDFSRDSEANRGALRTLTRTVATCLANYAQNSRKAVDPLATDNGDRRMPWAGMRVQIGNTALDSTEQDVFDETGLLAGRVPTASLAFAIFGNPRFLEVCPSFGPVRNWWNHWRDHLYYAVSVDFSPFDPFEESNLLTATMCRGHCLSATDDDPDSYKYAAIVIFAGEKIGAQQRRLAYDVVTNTNALADRHDFANYLEGKNRVNFAQVPPLTYLNPPTALQRVYGRATTPPNEYNDIMYCIRVPTAFATPSIEPC